MKRYLVLWKGFNNKQFTLKEAIELFSQSKILDDNKIINLALSELRKAGWINIDFDSNDRRKRVYTLKVVDFNKEFSEFIENKLGGSFYAD